MEAKTTELSGGMDRKAQHHENQGGPVPLAGASPGAFVFSGRGPRIMLAPPDAPGPAGDPAPVVDPAPAADPSPAPAADPAPTPPARPDYIPESFWDAEKGFKADDLNALVAFKAEHDSNAALVPEKPDGYQVSLPKDFQLPEGFELPEGQEAAIDENDPRIGVAREFAHKAGFSQTQFEDLIAMGVQMDFQEQQQLNTLLGEQAEKLGAKGKERVAAVTQWMGAKLGGDAAKALAPMLYTAQQVQAFERLMSLFRGAVPGNPGGGRDSGKTELSDEEYNKMSPTEQINYARQHSKK